MFGKLIAFAMTLVIGALVFAGVAFGQDAPSNVVDFGPLVDAGRSAIVEIVIALLGIAGLWLAAILKKKWGIDIEAQVRNLEAMHRSTVHSAVDTWTKAAMAKFGDKFKLEPGNPALQYILDGVARSAPEAIKVLDVGERWIVNKAAGIAGVELQ